MTDPKPTAKRLAELRHFYSQIGVGCDAALDYADELAAKLEAERAKRLPTHYESNGEAGDGQTVCDVCGGETDEGHEPTECAQVVALNIDHGWHVAGVATDEAESLREKLKAAEDKLRAAEAVVEQLKARLALKASVYTAEEQAADRAEVLAWDFEKGEPR